MKFSISYPDHGTTKSLEVDDDNKCRVFFERKMGETVEAESLGDEYKGYVFKINGGYDQDGFAMKQGVFSNQRVKLLLKPGSKGYRCKRTGEKQRKSIRGCIVGPDIKMLSVSIVKKGDNEIPGLTDTTKPRRLGPKRAVGIRKLYGIEKGDKSATSALIKKNVIRRTFKSKANEGAPMRQKAPKIQRLITDVRLRRKKINKENKIKRWKRTLEATAEYAKVYDAYINKKKKTAAELRHIRKDSKVSADKEPIKKDVKKDTKKTETKPAKNTTTRVEIKPSNDSVTGAHVKAAITKTRQVVKKKE